MTKHILSVVFEVDGNDNKDVEFIKQIRDFAKNIDGIEFTQHHCKPIKNEKVKQK